MCVILFISKGLHSGSHKAKSGSEKKENMGEQTRSRKQGDRGCYHSDKRPVWMVLLLAGAMSGRNPPSFWTSVAEDRKI